MMEILDTDLMEWGFTLIAQASIAGLSASCIAAALYWAVLTVVKLLHKFF